MTTSNRTRFVAPALLIALAAAAVVVIAGSGGTDRRVSFVVPSATNFFEGLKVRAAGQTVGSISSLETVEGGRAARVELKLTDEKVWPLPRDTRIRLRYGGTISYAQRYVELQRGRAEGTPIADGGTVPSANVDVPAEFDRLFSTFGPRTRRDLRATLDNTGAALKPAARPLRRAIGAAPPAVEEARGLFADLGSDRSALRTLVRSSDRVVHAANRARPGMAALLSEGATTFSALGSRATEVRQLLERMPRTLVLARQTLARADRTLRSVETLSGPLRPGVEELIHVTPPLNRALQTLTDVAPDTVSTARTLRKAAPDLTALLDEGARFMPKLGSVARQGAKQLACIRPYAPEIAGFASTWASFTQNGDGKDKYARLFNAAYPFGNDTAFGVPEAARMLPSAFADYGFPRAPGANAGQPWFLPECNVTRDGLDPQKNPEAPPPTTSRGRP